MISRGDVSRLPNSGSMHYLEDTEQEDSVRELFWREDYKKVLRNGLRKTILSEMSEDTGFQSIYEVLHSDTFSSFESFARSISNMIEIGCENGADLAFDEIYFAFRNHLRLPNSPRFYRYLWPQIPSAETVQRVKDEVISEFSCEKPYRADYEDFYSRMYPTFGEFLDEIAQLVATGVVHGADSMIGQIYRSFLLRSPLPVARRRPRRLKGW